MNELKQWTKALKKVRKRVESDNLKGAQKKLTALQEAIEASSIDTETAEYATVRASFAEWTGKLANKTKNHAKAVEAFKALVHWEKLSGEPDRGLGFSYGRLGDALLAIGNAEEALSAHETASKLLQNTPLRNAMGTFIGHAKALEAVGQMQDAVELWATMAPAALESDLPQAHRAYFQERLARACAKVNDPREEAALMMVIRLASGHASPPVPAEYSVGIEGQIAALAASDKGGEHQKLRDVWRRLGQIYMNRAEPETATRALGRSIYHARTGRSGPRKQFPIRMDMATACTAAGQLQNAEGLLLQAWADMKQVRIPMKERLPLLRQLHDLYTRMDKTKMAAFIEADIAGVLGDQA